MNVTGGAVGPTTVSTTLESPNRRLSTADSGLLRPGWWSQPGSGQANTASTALYLCSDTLISLMPGECRVGTEVGVANLPKVCTEGAEGGLSPGYRTSTLDMVPAHGIEP